MPFYTKLKIILTLILSIIVSFFVYTYLKDLKDETTIVVAVQDIEAHTLIKPEMIKEVPISKKDKGLLEKNSVSTKKELQNAISNVKIRKDKTIIKNDDVIAGTKEELVAKKAMLENGEVNDAYFISDNKRITTVALDKESAVGDKLNQGDYVDVIFTNKGDALTSFSTTILQHIEIYSIEKSQGNSVESSQNISLIVTPQQAVDITLAKRSGKIDLILDSSKGNSESTYTSTIKKFIDASNSTNSNEN
jgi:pilus assembly protein CpaB